MKAIFQWIQCTINTKTMKKSLFLIGLLSAIAVSCSVNEVVLPEESVSTHVYPDVIHAVIDDQPDAVTKVYNDNLQVKWNSYDYITLFPQYSIGCPYYFTGNDGDVSGDFEIDGNAGDIPAEGGVDLDMFYGVYPHLEETSINEDGIISLSLPDVQCYEEDSFGHDANTMVSRTKTEDLSFKNVGGYLTFKLYGEGVSVNAITLKGNNGELLAGNCTIDVSSGEPVVTMTKGTEKITLECGGVYLNAESEEYVEFWMVIPPTTFSKGITFIVTDDSGGVWSMSSSASFSIGRNAKKSVPVQRVVPEIPVNIEFADPTVESICVKYWDNDEDGMLSEKEAASVKTLLVDEGLTKAGNLVSAFAGTDITTFDELTYFTGLIKIDDRAFAGCTALESITIPETVEVIGADAFNGCTSLESITFTSVTPPTIGSDAFANTNDCPIIVPIEAVDEYIDAAGWSGYANRIQSNSISFKVPVICNVYEKSIDNQSLAEALGVSESQYADYTYDGVYGKDGDSYSPLSPSDICGTAEMTDDGFVWSIDPNDIEDTETIYLKFIVSSSELYLPVTAEKAAAPKFDFGTNRISNEWYDDIDGEAKNTVRINVPVPNYDGSIVVTDYMRDLSRFFVAYNPSIVPTEDTDPIYGELMNSGELVVDYTYGFASEQPVIYGTSLIAGDDGKSLYAGSVSEGNLVAYFDEDGKTVVYANSNVAKELLNLWSYTVTDQARMLYANILVKMSYGECNIPCGESNFHIRFIRPVDINLSALDVTIGSVAPLPRFFSSIVDWNHQSLIVKNSSTGHLSDNIIRTIDMYTYYQFSSIIVDLGNATVPSGVELQLGTETNGVFTASASSTGVYTISATNISDINNYVIQCNGNASASAGYANIPVTFNYAWGSIESTFAIKLRN